MKKIIFTIVYLIYPSFLAIAVCFGDFWVWDYLPYIAFYVVSAIGVIFYTTFKPCKYKILIIGMTISFLPVIIGTLITDFVRSGNLITTVLLTLFSIAAYIGYFILPYAIISALTFTIYDKIKGKRTC
jgi:predicted branched-subunit amino acid permease